MAGITGIGSGMDIDSIVTALVNAEKAPKEAQLARLEKATTEKFSAIGQFKSAIGEFQAALKDLNSATLFEKRTASSSNATLATATATKSAVSGNYQLTVESLATASKVATKAVADDYVAGGNGSLTIKLGADDAGVSVNVAAGDSLTKIRDSINAALGSKGISANIVRNPSDGASRLVLSGKETGDGQDIYIESSTAALDDFKVGSIDYSDPANPVGSIASLDTASSSSSGFITQAKDAVFTIDGLSLKSASNTVSDAIPEVTLNLLSAEPGKKFSVTVDQDRAGVKSNIKKFVDAYNKMMGVSKSLTSVVSAGEGKAPVAGALVGDSSVRSLIGTVRNELVRPAEQDGIRILADLGITTQNDGTLKIDDTKLDKALSENFESVAGFFTGDTGLMNRLNGKVGGFTQAGGILEKRLSGLQETLTSVDKQRESLTLRVQQIQTRLYKQFNAMDSLVGQLNQTSDRLAQALSNLPGVVKKES